MCHTQPTLLVVEILLILKFICSKQTVACTYAERRRHGDVDFDYGVDNLQLYYDEDFNS